MFKRCLPVRAAGLAALGAVILLAASVVGASAGDRVRLETDVLTRSRGGNSYLSPYDASCNLLMDNSPCSHAGDPCVSCDVSTYDGLGLGVPGGSKQDAGVQSCGNDWAGTCDSSQNCSQDRQVGLCTSPSNVGPQ
jgi:hypothetical protein